MKRCLPIMLGCALLAGCTTRYQVRGTETVLPPIRLEDLTGSEPRDRAMQISMEHQSIERYTGDHGDFSLGIIEISDEGAVNRKQRDDVIDWVVEQTAGKPGLLVIFAHGWHHGARTCDRDLCCFRTVLSELKKSGAGGGGTVIGLYLGWRGESLPYRGWNLASIWSRKRVAERIGRTAVKEILLEIEERAWDENEDLVMVTVGHSLGGAMVYQAVKGRLTGNISDIELGKVRSYRVVRTEESRVDAFDRQEKARRAGFGELVVLVNPALEASEYQIFDNDLEDRRFEGVDREALTKALQPYDKQLAYPASQLPVLMTLASEADSAVGRIFPIARSLQAPINPRQLARRRRTGLGHYAPQVTHRLEAPPGDFLPPEVVSPQCECTKVAAAMEKLPPLSLDVSSDLPVTHQGAVIGRDGKGGEFRFGVTAARHQRGWDPRSPYLVVETDSNVISEHSDIFNPTVVAFLSAYINAYDREYQSLTAAEKRPATP
jgi:hypothetical protein